MRPRLPPELQVIVEREITHLLSKRNETSTKGFIILAVIVTLVLCSALGLYFTLRYLRQRNARPTYLPTTFLKTKWRAWEPGWHGKRRPPSSLHQDVRGGSGISMASARASSPADVERLERLRDSRGTGYDGSSVGSRNAAETAAQAGAVTDAEGAGVDRTASVRSIMTLPTYSATARPSEKIMGREGERAGMDVVVEFPEDNDEEEARRDQEMESLYQIRLARREQQAARRLDREIREQARRLREDARARGDRRAVRELREAERQARIQGTPLTQPEASNPEEMMAELQQQKRGRERRISSVAYASLGVARHDGSRVRSDSASSDNRPLLDNATAMGSRSVSRGESPSYQPHSDTGPLAAQPVQRDRNYSTSSLSRFIAPNSDVSDSDQSDLDFEVPTPFDDARSRSRSGSSQAGDRLGHASERPSSRLRIDSSDLGDRAFSQHRRSGDTMIVSGEDEQPPPPDYDNLSPVQEQRKAAQRHLPTARDRTTDQDLERGEAPPYESPTRDRPREDLRLNTFARLPSIRVTPFTPFEDPAAGGQGRDWFA